MHYACVIIIIIYFLFLTNIWDFWYMSEYYVTKESF